MLKNVMCTRHSFEGILGWLNSFSLIAAVVFPLIWYFFRRLSLSLSLSLSPIPPIPRLLQ